VFGNIGQNKRKLTEGIQAFDVIEERRALGEEEIFFFF
jgi:hypothetical protein